MAYLEYDEDWRQGERVRVRSIGPDAARPKGLTRTHRRAWWARFDLLRARLALVQALTNIAATREGGRGRWKSR